MDPTGNKKKVFLRWRFKTSGSQPLKEQIRLLNVVGRKGISTKGRKAFPRKKEKSFLNMRKSFLSDLLFERI